MRKLAILHFNPLELYPPVMNLLRLLDEQSGNELSVRVYSTWSDEEIPALKLKGASVRIIRKGTLSTAGGKGGSYGVYARYYPFVALDLLRWRPDTVLVFETLSFAPAYFYKRLINRQARLMIHYHEYTSLQEYEQGMKLNRKFHAWEKRIYPQTVWVSHTNEERMRRFLADHATIRIPHTYIIPNYPPASWVEREGREINAPVRIVYVGSLGMDSMYLREFAEWVIAQQGRFTWDIFALHVSGEVREYLDQISPDLIRFRGACFYYDLPSILRGYDVGVVLYKGVSDNHIHAVSNKVLEYLACGLDVWYTREMTGTDPYITPEGAYPRVLPLDLSIMDRFDPGQALDRRGAQYRPSPYFCEAALAPLLKEIKDHQDADKK